VAKGFRSLAINVAQLCNLKCTYCAAGGDGTFGDPMKQVDLGILNDQIRMLLHDVPNGGEFRFTFLGGEPLLAPEALRAIHRYSKLQAAGRNIKLRYDIVTNGTLVTPAIAELLASMACNVTVSLDGPKEVNDKSRPTRSGQGSTERTLAGVRNLLDVKERLGSLSAGSVFGKHFTGVVETYKFLKEQGFERFRFDFAVGDQDEAASRAYVEGIKAIADLAWQAGGESELRKISMFDLYFQVLDNRERMRNHCGAGKTHLHTDTRGNLSTCQWFVGDKSEQVGAGTVIDQEALKAYADPLVEKNDCGTCWVRNICGGGCMYVNKTKSGSKFVKDSEFCIRTRSIIAKGIEYYAEARYENREGN
ncbi:MAG: radical SAM protein, partial [Proteobacteria bacterium]